MGSTKIDYIKLLQELTDVGIALSAEKDHLKLLELIMKKAKEFTHADGATLYESVDDEHLRFEIMMTESLKLHLGGTSGKPIDFELLPLNDDRMVATWAANNRKTANIKDAYRDKKFDFSGTYEWDKKIGYHSKSFLTVPLTNHLNEVIGVLQLINARHPKTKKIISFSKLDQELIESLASQAAISITNHRLIEAQKKLFDSLIQLIAYAIDEKSAYTAGHCRRVPIITRMLADAVCRINTGPLKKFNMSEDEKYELEVAAWLHDCGKITTPEYVVDKATKLETIFDRIHLVDTRFEVLKRDAIIDSLRRQLKELTGNKRPNNDNQLKQKLNQLNRERDQIREFNVGKETISDEALELIQDIAAYQWIGPSGHEEAFLSPEEVQNLKIYRGTLTIREREIINNHVKVTERMLKALPYPKNLSRVPEFASAHHEKMDGTGYPKGLTGKQMPIQARMIAIADVFEALTAADRPYKKALTLSKCLAIMLDMRNNGHIDPDLFDVFMHEKIYLDYARQYLPKESIDAIDVNAMLGYRPLN